MCQQVAKGTRWGKCGHFQRHLVVAIVDCCKANCERSCYHPPNCRARCITIFGPEIEQDVDYVADEYCFRCRAAQAKAAGVPLR